MSGAKGITPSIANT